MYTVESLNDDAKPNIYAVVGSTFACAASEEMATMASANAILNTFISYFSSTDILEAVVPPVCIDRPVCEKGRPIFPSRISAVDYSCCV